MGVHGSSTEKSVENNINKFVNMQKESMKIIDPKGGNEKWEIKK